MAKIQVNRLTNANIYLNGKSLLGKAEEVSLPDIKHILSDHKALGMIGKLELWSGIDKMEMKIKWNSFYADTHKAIASPFSALNMQVRSSLETYTSGSRTSQAPVVVYVNGQSKNIPTGNFKQHDNVEAETTFSIIYLKQVINGEVIVEFDVLSNIFKVGGVNVMAEYNANLGI